MAGGRYQVAHQWTRAAPASSTKRRRWGRGGWTLPKLACLPRGGGGGLQAAQLCRVVGRHLHSHRRGRHQVAHQWTRTGRPQVAWQGPRAGCHLEAQGGPKLELRWVAGARPPLGHPWVLRPCLKLEHPRIPEQGPRIERCQAARQCSKSEHQPELPGTKREGHPRVSQRSPTEELPQRVLTRPCVTGTLGRRSRALVWWRWSASRTTAAPWSTRFPLEMWYVWFAVLVKWVKARVCYFRLIYDAFRSV